MSELPIVYGADYSVYVRIVRLCLAEKSVHYKLESVDIFSESANPEYRERHPFSKIPAFRYGDFDLYETGAITRYIDDAFPGPSLLPTDIKERARCNQLISIADNYAYPNLVWGVYVEQISKPHIGEETDHAKLAASRVQAERCLHAISALKAEGPWMTGKTLSLCDLYLAPVFDYFTMTTDGKKMLTQHPDLAGWWTKMQARQSMQTTKPSRREA